jgi:hypothetical protein
MNDPYQIQFAEHSGYLRVAVRGPNTAETIGRYLVDIYAECQRLTQNRVLIIVDLHGPGLSMLDVYKALATGFDATGGSGIRVAYVDLRDHSVANMLLAENVAMTRGLPLRTFRDAAAAEAWLLGAPAH